MKSVIDHRPIFPSNSAFLVSGSVLRCVYAEGMYECYQVRLSEEKEAIGVVTVCNTHDEAMVVSRKLLAWWQKLGNERLKVVTHSTEILAGKSCFLALLVVTDKQFNLVSSAGLGIDSGHADSILRDLLHKCQSAHQVGFYPWIEVGAVALSQRFGETLAIPFLLRMEHAEADSEAKCVESIGRFIYALATGINLKEHGRSKAATGLSVQAAHLWNKNID